MKGGAPLGDVMADVWNSMDDDEQSSLLVGGKTTYRALRLSFDGHFAPITWQWQRLKSGITVVSTENLPTLASAVHQGNLVADRIAQAAYLKKM
jgi:hypothetical protein